MTEDPKLLIDDILDMNKKLETQQKDINELFDSYNGCAHEINFLLDERNKGIERINKLEKARRMQGDENRAVYKHFDSINVRINKLENQNEKLFELINNLSVMVEQNYVTRDQFIRLGSDSLKPINVQLEQLQERIHWHVHEGSDKRIASLEKKLSIHQAELERKWQANTELSNRLAKLESKLSQQNPAPDLAQSSYLEKLNNSKKTKTLWISVATKPFEDGYYHTTYALPDNRFIKSENYQIVKIEIEVDE